MSVSLEDALGQVDLEAGQIYHCRVNGQWVVVRVLEPGEVPLSTRYDESDVMLDPWVEFPLSGERITVVGRPGVPRLPDPPIIPNVHEFAMLENQAKV
jgi:hypothetical protein